MRVTDAVRSEYFFGSLEGAGDFLWCFDMVHFDVHNAETNTETRVDPFECVEIGRRPVGEFEDQVVGVKTVQERNQGLPLSFLNGLSAVITETKMDGLLDAYS